LAAGSLRIETFEGSRPEFDRVIAYWVFNRATTLGDDSVSRKLRDLWQTLISGIAVALPNNTTRKRLPL
jgi:hypothetical protein